MSYTVLYYLCKSWARFSVVSAYVIAKVIYPPTRPRHTKLVSREAAPWLRAASRWGRVTIFTSRRYRGAGRRVNGSCRTDASLCARTAIGCVAALFPNAAVLPIRSRCAVGCGLCGPKRSGRKCPRWRPFPATAPPHRVEARTFYRAIGSGGSMRKTCSQLSGSAQMVPSVCW